MTMERHKLAQKRNELQSQSEVEILTSQLKHISLIDEDKDSIFDEDIAFQPNMTKSWVENPSGNLISAAQVPDTVIISKKSNHIGFDEPLDNQFGEQKPFNICSTLPNHNPVCVPEAVYRHTLPCTIFDTEIVPSQGVKRRTPFLTTGTRQQ